MAQPSVASFFNTRKRAAGTEDVANIKNKRLIEPFEGTTQDNSPATTDTTSDQVTQQDDEITTLKGLRTRSGRTVKRIGVLQSEAIPKKLTKTDSNLQQKKLVQFIKKGPLSPRKKVSCSTEQLMQKANEETPSISQIKASSNIERGLKTPTKQIIKGKAPLKHAEIKSMVRKELNFDEVKTKISRSAKLQELKASLSRIQELEKTRKAQEEHNRRLREGIKNVSAQKTPIVQLKEFDTIELEVLTSPSKTFKTPIKLPPPTPDKNELMSPRHTHISKRVLFSPAKDGSPSKMVLPPAYQRFMSLAETSKAGHLPLPYKYRNLIEIFKGIDSVCAMFHNRKECITFKKLKPAAQRMLRKNVTEAHLAQIKHLYPDAFIFTQMKMRNYGSTSKADYFQMVISPNVENVPERAFKMPTAIDEDNILAAAQSSAMNPLIMTERMRHFQQVLLQRVLDEHDRFIKSLDPPLSIPKSKVTRWHPDFDLEKCSDIELGHLPQPPNVEKYSSARDILSTARNLFNCATPMERAIERYEAKLQADRVVMESVKKAAIKNETKTQEVQITKETDSSTITTAVVAATAAGTTTTTTTAQAVTVSKTDCIIATRKTAKTLESTITTAAPAMDATSTLLKGVPKSLLEKIRAKQAAKALDAMTRRPSQDQEATKYSRLPELARHLRNVFITERKGVLTLEVIIKKIQNSFRTCLTAQEVEAHLKLLAKEVPTWIAFHEVRKTMYLKIAKDMDMSKVVEQLEKIANEKSK